MLPAIGFCAIVIVVLAVSFAWERWRLAAFNERFPPISDDEFMARCPAGTNRAVALKVRRIVADSLGVEYTRIYPTSSLVGDLGAE